MAKIECSPIFYPPSFIPMSNLRYGGEWGSSEVLYEEKPQSSAVFRHAMLPSLKTWGFTGFYGGF